MSPRIIPFPSGSSRGPKKSGGGSRYFPLGSQEPWYIFLQVGLITAFVIWSLSTSFLFITPLPLDVMFGLMVLYWAFIHQQIQRSGFLRKNWILLLIIGLALALIHPMTAVVMAVCIVLYVCFFGRSAYGPSSFVRFHLLSMLVMFTMLLWLGLLSNAMVILLIRLMHLVHLSPVVSVLNYVQLGMWGLLVGLLGVGGLTLAIGGLMGKAPNLPFVTRQVAYWA